MEDAKEKLGQFVHFGFENALRGCINADLHNGNVLYIVINIDGFSLTKSGNNEVQANSGKIHIDPDIYDAFPIAIFHGERKPNLDRYLEEFVNEINDLHRQGIVISNRHFEVHLKGFICDRPARSFLKNTLGHGAEYVCERCGIEEFSEKGTTVHPLVNKKERTDTSFRNRRQRENHYGPLPLERIIPGISIVFLCWTLCITAG